MTVEVENTCPAVGFLDPECLYSTTLNSKDNTLDFSVSYMRNAFKLYAKKEFNAYLLSLCEPLDCSGGRSEAAEGLLS
jgi:hypothetical protein